MKQDWHPEQLALHWTLSESELNFLAQRRALLDSVSPFFSRPSNSMATSLIDAKTLPVALLLISPAVKFDLVNPMSQRRGSRELGLHGLNKGGERHRFSKPILQTHIKAVPNCCGRPSENNVAVNSLKLVRPKRCKNAFVVAKRKRPSLPANSSTSLRSRSATTSPRLSASNRRSISAWLKGDAGEHFKRSGRETRISTCSSLFA
jgi:hypothetical protein